MSKKIKIIFFVIFLVFLMEYSVIVSCAESNPYPGQQNVDGDAYNEIPCTWFVWQHIYNNLNIALPAWGNAGQWLDNAKRSGYATGQTAVVNSIAVWSDSGYGHVAFVSSVSGSNMTIAEGGRTDLDHTGSQGICYDYTLSAVVGSKRNQNTQTLIGFIYLNNDSLPPQDSDTTPPTISNVTVSKVNYNGYTVSCTVTDDVGVTSVRFPTSRSRDNSAIWFDGQKNGNTWTFTYTGAVYGDAYWTHIYAYDAAGNYKVYGTGVSYCANETDVFKPVDGGVYEIESAVDDSKVLDINTDDNAQIYDRNSARSQKFKIEHVRDGFYKIINTNSEKVLDVTAANAYENVNLQQHIYNETDAQLFRFLSSGDGYYYIVSALGNYFDLDGGITTNGNNIKMYFLNKSKAQKWKLVSVDEGNTVLDKLGDVNQDGAIDGKDVSLLLQYRLKKQELTEEQISAGDVYADGVIDGKDVSKLLQYRLGKIGSLE